jgi:FkbM family methyltransferase
LKLSSISYGKVVWLWNNSAFKTNPWKVLSRILIWEWLRLFNQSINYSYDKTFPITLRPNEGVSRLTFYFGVSEPDLFAFYDSFLRPGMFVMDVGANIGLHSLFMAKRVAPSGKVYALEPAPEIFRRLEENVASSTLKNLFIFPLALGEKSGVARINDVPEDTSRTFLTNSGQGSLVPVETLDDFCHKNSIGNLNFLKLDVEGFEEMVLRGGGTFFQNQRCDVLQVEVDNNSLSRQSSRGDSIVAWLRDRGYQFAAWDSIRGKFSVCPAETRLPYNSFFVSTAFYEKEGSWH